MTKPTGFTESMNTLAQRFKEKRDPQNPLHGNLQTRLNDLSGQVKALEVIRQTGDPLTAQRAAGRLKFIATEAELWLTSKSAEAEASYNVTLREKSGLVNGPYAGEIRARLHGMKQGDKVKTVQALIEARDGASLQAVFDAPSMLTGLSPDDLGKFREQFYQTAVPDLVKARDLTRDLNEHLQAAIKTSFSAARSYNDPARLKELEEREAASAAAQKQMEGGSHGG